MRALVLFEHGCSLSVLQYLPPEQQDCELRDTSGSGDTNEIPWSLYGLAESLRLQQKEEAETVEERFRRAWRTADIKFEPARFDALLAVGTFADTTQNRPR